MNALIQKSNEARDQLLALTGLDELDYHLLILESGCQCLDELVRPVGTLDKETCELYREHLGRIGWWTWYEYTFRAYEVRLAAEWTGPESLVPHQDKAWCRAEFLKEAYTLRHTSHYAHAFDAWLKMKEEGGKLKMNIPAAKATQTQMQHAH